MKSIALIHAKRENYDEAIGIFTEVLDVKRDEMGRSHPEVAGAHKRIGNVHYQRGDLAGADEEYRRALAIYQHSLGCEHQTTKSAQAMLEKVAKEMGADRGGRQQQQQQQANAGDAQQSSLSSSGTSLFKRAPKGYESL